MPTKQFETRIKSKHDTTANWNAAIGFIPLDGEIIIYDYKQINGTINSYDPEVNPIVSGSISTSDGTDIGVHSFLYLRSDGYISAISNTDYSVSIISQKVDTIRVYFYNGQEEFISCSDSESFPFAFRTPTNCGKIRFVLMADDHSVFRLWPSDVKLLRIDREGTINVPGIKIGTGNVYVQDLPFTDDPVWKKMLDMEDEVINETLVFKRG